MVYGLFWDRFCQVMHPAMVETRFIASSRDGPAVGSDGAYARGDGMADAFWFFREMTGARHDESRLYQWDTR